MSIPLRGATCARSWLESLGVASLKLDVRTADSEKLARFPIRLMRGFSSLTFPPHKRASVRVMTMRRQVTAARLAGALLLTSLIAMIASAIIATSADLTLNPSDTAATLAAIHERVALHLIELGLDVLGWLCLLAAALVIAARMVAVGQAFALLPTGLLAAAALAGVLHDVGNLAVTQLASVDPDPSTVAVAEAVLLSAKWGVNLAGLLWVTATAAALFFLRLSPGLRRFGLIAVIFGLISVALPWTTGVDGPSLALEQTGYLLFLPVMAWYGALGWRELRTPSAALTFDRSTEPENSKTISQ